MVSTASARVSAATAALLSPEGRARIRVGAGAVVVLVLLGLAVAVLVTAVSPKGESERIEPHVSASGAPAALIYVHVDGMVGTPGLYELSAGARAVDAIAAAGGFTVEADRSAVNLARFVDDGEQLIVPAAGAEGPTAGIPAGDGRVNLNTADAATLETLPRVGPAMAAKIIEWRETNGRFATVDDLLAVSGIGEKTLEGMRSLVTV